MALEMKEQNEIYDRISINDYRKEVQADLENACIELERTITTDIKIAKLQNKIELYREILSNLKRLE